MCICKTKKGDRNRARNTSDISVNGKKNKQLRMKELQRESQKERF